MVPRFSATIIAVNIRIKPIIERVVNVSLNNKAPNIKPMMFSIPAVHRNAAIIWVILGLFFKSNHLKKGTKTQYAEDRKRLFPGISNITPIV